MTIAVVLLAGGVTLLLGRLMFRRWFNQVSVYGFLWSFSLALFQVGLIHYYPIETETWLIIGSAWIAFILGSGVVLCARFALTGEARPSAVSVNRRMTVDTTSIGRLLWVVSIITVADSIYEVLNLKRILGSVSNIFALANLLYRVRVHEGIPGAIPYIGTLTLVGALVAGFYTAKVGKLKFVVVIVILCALTNSVTSMVRANLIVAGTLFLTGYMTTRTRPDDPVRSRRQRNVKRVLALAAIGLMIVGGMELVRGTRGMTEGFAGESTSLKRLNVGPGSFITPSIFMYLTVQYGVMNQYFVKETENVPIGHYTFAPVWRFLSKLGFETYVEQHSRFYRTPVIANTGSYLRELHADYGMTGVIVGPFLLGWVTSLVWYRFERTQSLVDLVVLGHVFVITGMSLFTFATGMGVWLGSFVWGLILVGGSYLFARRKDVLSTELRHSDGEGFLPGWNSVESPPERDYKEGLTDGMAAH